MMNYWFVDDETGEEFFVQTNDINEAKEIARTYFEKPILYDVVSDEVAEMWGFDTY